jgi:hypothetical protein
VTDRERRRKERWPAEVGRQAATETSEEWKSQRFTITFLTNRLFVCFSPCIFFCKLVLVCANLFYFNP